jgi:hypothetical protein
MKSNKFYFGAFVTFLAFCLFFFFFFGFGITHAYSSKALKAKGSLAYSQDKAWDTKAQKEDVKLAGYTIEDLKNEVTKDETYYADKESIAAYQDQKLSKDGVKYYDKPTYADIKLNYEAQKREAKHDNKDAKDDADYATKKAEAYDSTKIEGWHIAYKPSDRDRDMDDHKTGDYDWNKTGDYDSYIAYKSIEKNPSTKQA